MRNFFIFFLVMALSYTANAEVNWFGGAQITAESGAGVNANGGLDELGNPLTLTSNTTSGLRYGAHMIRMGAAYKEDNRFAKIMAAYDGTTTAGAIKWAYIGHKFDYGFLNKIQVGKFKTIIGQELNVSWNKQEYTKYSALKTLQGSDMVGLVISGNLGFGLSYDLAAGNSENASNPAGKAMQYAAKLNYDRNDFHFQVGYLMDNEKTSVDASKDKSNSLDIATTYKMGAMDASAEYVVNKTKTGDTDTGKDVAYQVHFGYKFMKNMKALVKYVNYEQTTYSSGVANPSRSVSNIFLGFNLGNVNEMLKINYVIAGGDKRYKATPLTGIKRLYVDNAFLAQYQMTF